MPPRDITGPKPRKVRVRRKAPRRTPLGQNAPPAPKVVRRAKPAAGPPAPRRTAGPAGYIGPKRVVVRKKQKAGPPAPKPVARRVAGPAGRVGKQITNPKVLRRRKAEIAYDERLRKATGGRALHHALGENEPAIRASKVAGPSVTSSRAAIYPVKVKRRALGLKVGPVVSTPNDFDLVRGGKKVGTGTFTKDSNRFKQSAVDLTAQKFIAKRVTAPAVKVLNTATIPSHAIAGVAAGKSPGYGVRHHTTFSNVLKKHGVKGPLASVGGFVLDVATDPLTYATLGVGSVGGKAAEKAGRAATEAALKEGATKKAADKAGRAAAGAAMKDKGGRGVQLGARFHVPFTDTGVHLKTSGRTTAAIGRKLRPVAKPVRESGFLQGVGRGLVHDFRPKERTPEQHKIIRQAEREHRARLAQSRSRVVRKTQALQKVVKEEDHAKLADAIEANDYRSLTPEQAQAARAVRRDLDAAHEMTYKRGIGTERFRAKGPEDAAAYLPHYRKVDVDPKAKKKPSHGGTTRVAATKGRSIRQPLATLREDMPDLFSENVPRVVGVKLAREHERASLHDFWQKVAKTGRPLNRKARYDSGEEMVYRIDPDGLTALAKDAGRKVDQDAVNDALKDTTGRYVILNRRTVDDVKKKLSNTAASEEGLVRGYDRAQGKLKLLYTQPNPSYHIRNLFGDSLNAFTGDASATSFKDSVRALKAQSARNKLERTSLDDTKPAALDKPLKLGKAGTTTLGKELQRAEEHGAIGGGFIGRELPDLVGKQSKLGRAGQYREDFPRMATYLSARKRGMSPGESAEWANKHHFDYGDLTSLERKGARRVIPFWTFFARNTRLQASKIVTRPGKVATLGKVLEESAKAAGFDSYESYAGDLKDYQQRGLPVPIPFGGKVYNVQIGPPTTDLNQVTTNPQAIAQDIGNRITFFKSIAELVPKEGYSIFFQQPIQPEGDELTDAPGLVGQLPGPIKRALGVQKVGDRWQWKKKTDYALRALPEGNLALSAAGASNPLRAQTRGQTIAGWATGAKITTYGTPQQRYSQLNQALHEASVEAERMRKREQAVAKDGGATPKYRKQLNLIKDLTAKRDQMRKDLKLPVRPTLRRKRGSKLPSVGGGLGGGGLGGGVGGGLSG